MQKGIDHIGVSVSYFCHDGKGKYLMNKRSAKCRDEHGCWDFGGGGIEHGDTIEESLRKELKEEYYIEHFTSKFIGYNESFRNFDGKKSHWIHLHFLVKVDPSEVKNGEPEKFDEIAWFKLNELPLPLHSATAGDLKQFRDELLIAS